MKRTRWQTALLVAAMLAVVPEAPAVAAAARTQRRPSIGYVYPAGGKQGTTFQVTIAGRYLDGVNNVVVSGGGVKATVVEHVKPLTGKQINLLRDELKVLQQKVKPVKQGNPKSGTSDVTKTAGNPVTKTDRAAIQKEMAEIRKKLANPKNRNRENQQLAEDVTLRVVLAPDAVPGERELRLKTNLGLSNPVAFHVNQLPEYTEKEPNSKTEDTMELLELPLVINGQIMPGDVDRFRLKLNKGARLVMAASARKLTPYIADAVPGWFQATMALYDKNGNELAYADDYFFHPDPVLFYEVPRYDEYVLEIKDAIYRGREDFVYRIAVGEFPFVTSIFPMGGPVGVRTSVAIKGWNLPVNELTLDAKDMEPGILPVSVRKGQLVSNRVPFAVDTLPEYPEKEPNNRQAIARKVKPPLIVNGRIDQPGDLDVFCFEGGAGDEIVAEVYARRLNSPVDSVLKLTDATGKKLIANDDHEDKGAGLTTHHADSLLSTKLPANGTYYLYLGDAQNKGGDAYSYRLRISPPRPDFELRVVPSSINARAGTMVPVTVYALRKDGFSGDITLSLKDAPKGFTLSTGRVPADKDQMQLRLKVPPIPPKQPLSLRLEGRAEIQGRQVVRPAVPAEDMMQAFIYRHLVPAKDLKVVVIGRAKPGTPVKRRSQKTVVKPTPAKQPKSK